MLNNGICALIGDLDILNLHFLNKIRKYSTKPLKTFTKYDSNTYLLFMDNKYYSTKITFIFFENTKYFNEWSIRNSSVPVLSLFIYLRNEAITTELVQEYKQLIENTSSESQVNLF